MLSLMVIAILLILAAYLQHCYQQICMCVCQDAVKTLSLSGAMHLTPLALIIQSRVLGVILIIVWTSHPRATLPAVLLLSVQPASPRLHRVRDIEPQTAPVDENACKLTITGRLLVFVWQAHERTWRHKRSSS